MKATKIFLISMISLALLINIFAFSNPQTTSVMGADGSTGELQVGFSEYVPGNSYLIIAKDLTVSSDYTLDFTTGVATQYNFTTGANEETVYYRVTLEEPTSGSVALITLESQSTGTAVDTIRLGVADVDALINSDTVIEIIMAVLVVLLLMGVAVGIKRKITG